MNRIARTSTALFLACALLLSASAATASEQPDASGARALIERTVDDVLVILNDPALDTPGRRAKLEEERRRSAPALTEGVRGRGEALFHADVGVEVTPAEAIDRLFRVTDEDNRALSPLGEGAKDPQIDDPLDVMLVEVGSKAACRGGLGVHRNN